MTTPTKKNRCVLCGYEYAGYGNNAMPLRMGRCCDACNLLVTHKRLRDAGADVPLELVVAMEHVAEELKQRLKDEADRQRNLGISD